MRSSKKIPTDRFGKDDIPPMKQPSKLNVNDIKIQGSKDPLVYNEGDQELEPYLKPLLK